MRGFKNSKAILALGAVVVWLAFAAPAAAVKPQFRAGAARIDITPPAAELPAVFKGINDHIYVRALVLESAPNKAIIAVAEVPMIQADFFDKLVQDISSEYNIAPEFILIGTSHTHNSLRVASIEQNIQIPNADQLSPEEIKKIRDSLRHNIPVTESFNKTVIGAIHEAIRQANQALQPARAGYAAGTAALVASRNEWLESQHRFIDGIDRTGTQPVDHTLGVHKFETLDGKPIALLLNYGIEPVELHQGLISGDVPGATSRYLEQELGGHAVAIFTIGAPATPLYRVWDESERPPGTALKIMNAMGVILGEEALARAAGIRDLSTNPRIAAVSDTLQCPGKITTPRNLGSLCAYTEDSDLPPCKFTTRDADPVELNMGLLQIGDVAYVLVNGNVVPALWDKVRQASPLRNTLLVGVNFGPFRFVVDDAAYPLNTYPATDTRARQGCAERGLIDGVRTLFERISQ